MHIYEPGKYQVEKNDNLGQIKFWNSINFNENILKQNDNSKDEL